MNYILLNKQIKNYKNNKEWELLLSTYVWIIILMLGPIVSPYFMLVSFTIQIYRLLRYNLNNALMDIVFTMPFLSMYKAPNGDILLVYYILVFNIVFLLKRHSFRYNSSLVIMYISFLYFILRIGDKYTTPIFICGGMFFLYLTLTNHFNFKFEKILKLFCLSTVISSSYALITIKFFNISYTNINLKGRFAGVFIDPNYYSIFLLLSLISLIVLKSDNKIQSVFFYLEFISLALFGALTGSKSFFLFFLLIIFYQIMELINKRKFFKIFFLILFLFFSLTYIERENIGIFELVLKRLNTVKDVNSLTTGRLNIWTNYIKYIFSDIKVILFGKGLDNLLLGRSTHNIILETIYNCGIIGLFLIIMFFISILFNLKRYYIRYKKISILSYFPIYSVLTLYLFLQGIATVEFYLLMFISFICFCLFPKKNN